MNNSTDSNSSSEPKSDSSEPKSGSSESKSEGIRRILINKLSSKPSDLIQIVGTLLMLTGFFVTLVGSFFPSYRPFLQVPLVLFGVSSIVVLFVIAQRGFALVVALLVLGVVLTTEESIIKISHLLGKSEIKSTLYISEQSFGQSQVAMSEQHRKDILKEFSSKIAEDDLRALNQALEKSVLLQIKAKVGKFRSLHELASGGLNWRHFVSKWNENALFKEEIQQLRYEGVLACGSSNFGGCQLTALGKQIVALTHVTDRLFEEKQLKEKDPEISVERPKPTDKTDETETTTQTPETSADSSISVESDTTDSSTNETALPSAVENDETPTTTELTQTDTSENNKKSAASDATNNNIDENTE